MSEEFKLQFYYNLYKNSPVGSREKFRERFRKKHGKFKYLPELILMIEKYQVEKFGKTIWNETTYSNSKKWKRR